MAHPLIVTETHGAYINVNDQLTPLDGAVVTYDKQSPNDMIIRIPRSHVQENAPIDAKLAYNYLDPDIRRMAVAAGLITQGEANQLGRVASNEPQRGGGSDGGSVA